MNNFQYYNPVRIVFGEGQIEKLAELVPTDARVLITYGGVQRSVLVRWMKSKQRWQLMVNEKYLSLVVSKPIQSSRRY